MPGRKVDREGHPAGTAAGEILGAAAGGLAGNVITSEFDAEEEARFWRENFATRPYRSPRRDFSYYEPAYRYGWESARRLSGPRSFEQAEPALKEGWVAWMVGDASPGRDWRELREAVRDAWLRIRGC